MVEFARLSSALDGNEALRRRARLAALSLTVLSGDEAISVDVGERIAVHRGAAPGAAFSLVAAPDLFRGGGGGHSAPLPAHRRRGWTAISRAPERSRDHAPLPRDRLRPAVARQVLAAARLRERGLPAHDRSLCRHGDGGVARARAGAAR